MSQSIKEISRRSAEQFLFLKDKNTKSTNEIKRMRDIEIEHALDWNLIEKMYQEGGKIETSKIKAIAYEFRIEKMLLEKIINSFELFKNDKDFFYSDRILRQISKKDEISEARKSAGRKGGEANAKQVLQKIEAKSSKGKETKGKERKGKETKVKEISTTSKEVEITSDIKEFSNEVLFICEFMARGICYTNEAFGRKYGYEKHKPVSRELKKKCGVWAEDIDKLMRIDKITVQEIKFVLLWMHTINSRDAVFWRQNIMSGSKLRTHFVKLLAIAEKEAQESQQEKSEGLTMPTGL